LIGLGPTGGFSIDRTAASLREGIELQVERLFSSRNAGVATIHSLIVSKLIK
jgi:hypothetical protein